MFRRLTIFMNLITFCFAQNAWAMDKEDMSGYNEVLKQSELTKRPISLNEFLAKFGAHLPTEYRQQLEALAKENPKFMIPQMDVRKIQVNGQDQLQISVNTKQGSVAFTSQDSDKSIFSMVGNFNGKEIKSNLTYKDVLFSHYLAYQVRINANEQKPKILTADQFNKLTIDQKKDYMKHVRELLAAAEAVQYAIPSRGSDHGAFMELLQMSFLGLAYAADEAETTNGSQCVVAGWTNGVWDSAHSICDVPKEYKDPKSCSKVPTGQNIVRCNPDVFGDGLCVGFDGSDNKHHATAHCSDQDKDLSHYVDHVVNVQKKVGDDFFKHVAGMANYAQKTCATNPPSNDQKETCSAFQTRLNAIAGIKCGAEVLKGRQGFPADCTVKPPAPTAGPQNPDPKVNGARALAGGPKKAKGAGADGAGAGAAAAAGTLVVGPDGKPVLGADGKPVTAEQLKDAKPGSDDLCSRLNAGTVSTTGCNISTVMCDGTPKQSCGGCTAGFDQTMVQGTQVIQCVPHDANADKKTDNKKEEDEGIGAFLKKYKSELILGGVVLAVLGLFWFLSYEQRMQEKQMRLYYQQYTTGTTVPLPAVSTIGTLAPPPPGSLWMSHPGGVQ